MAASAFTRFGNDSAAPLPLIPRRASSVSSSSFTMSFVSASSPSTPPATEPVMLFQPPTPSPPRPAPGTADTTPAPSPVPLLTPTPRHHRRIRGASGGSYSTFLLRPPEDSTPIPASGSLDWTPRPRRVHIPKELMMTPRNAPAPAPIQRAMSSSNSTPDTATPDLPPLRLSNGKPLKSSLKSSQRLPRPPLSVVTSPNGSMRSKSAPATPRVHFDAQLEHVKLFLAEQKPLAVSRDGSPTDDTSADEFPAFIFRPQTKGTIVMQRLNFVEIPASTVPDVDVTLQSVSHAPEVPALNGVVRVRNIAFEKRVAIRFTFDGWQTTSEVIARYAGACTTSPATHDRFTFVIKLNDLLPGRERTLLFAVRYSAAGREMWDNNNGQDYRLRFYHELTALPPTGSAPPASPTPPAMDRQVEDLRARLEAVVRGEDTRGRETVGALLAAHSRQRWAGTPDDVGADDSADPPPLRFKGGAPLAERYSFASALRDTKDKGRNGAHTRTSTYPTVSSVPFPGTSPHNSPHAPQNSPSKPVNSSAAVRIGPGFMPLPSHHAFVPVSGFSPRHSPRGDEVLSISPTPRHAGHGRHHSRGGVGYFDNQAVRRTPPTSPTRFTFTLPSADASPDTDTICIPSPARSPSPQPPALSTSPSPSPSPETNSLELPETPDQSGDDDADAEAEMESESALATPTPTYVACCTPDARGFAPDWIMPLGKTASLGRTKGLSLKAQMPGASESLEGSRSPSPAPRDIERKDSPMHHLGDYHALLNKFCFFTGDSGSLQVPRAELGRTDSMSSVDNLLSLSSRDSSLQVSPVPSGSTTPVVAQ